MVVPWKGVVEQRDRGMQEDSSQKVVIQVDSVAKEAFGTLAFIGKGTKYRALDIMIPLYKMWVRSLNVRTKRPQ